MRFIIIIIIIIIIISNNTEQANILKILLKTDEELKEERRLEAERLEEQRREALRLEEQKKEEQRLEAERLEFLRLEEQKKEEDSLHKAFLKHEQEFKVLEAIPVEAPKTTKKFLFCYKFKNLQGLDLIFEKWAFRSKRNFSLLFYENFYLQLFFLFFCFLKKKAVNKNLQLFKIFYRLNNNLLFKMLKILSFIRGFANFNNLFSYLVSKLSYKWNQFILKKFSKFFFKAIDLKNKKQLFLFFFKKILNFLCSQRLKSIFSFVALKLNSFFLGIGRFFFFKRINFIFSCMYLKTVYFNSFF